MSLIVTESRAQVETLDIYTLGSASGSYHRSNVLIKELLERQGVNVGEVKVMNNCKNFNAIYDKVKSPSIFLTDGLYQGQPGEVCDTPTSKKNVISQRAMSVLLLCGQGVKDGMAALDAKLLNVHYIDFLGSLDVLNSN